jgi:tetratricopeptide (TPR) repeat protein
MAQQVAWLKALNALGYTELVTLLVQIISGDQPLSPDAQSIPGAKGEPGSDFDEMLKLQLASTLSQLSGNPGRALELLRALKVSLRYWLTGLEVEITDIASQKGETTGNFHEMQDVLHTIPDFADLGNEIILSSFGLVAQAKGLVVCDSATSQNPFITMKSAEMQAAIGEMDIARGIAHQAVAQLEKQAPDWNDLYYPKFILSWDPTSFVRTLLELDLISEALRCALEILNLRPADAKLINQISRIYNRLGEKTNALKYAHLAVTIKPEELDYHRHLATLWESLANWRK